MLAGWLNTDKSGKRGASRTYSDLAIATMSTMGSVMHLRGRQTEGFMTSLFQLMAGGLAGAGPFHGVSTVRQTEHHLAGGRGGMVLAMWLSIRPG